MSGQNGYEAERAQMEHDAREGGDAPQDRRFGDRLRGMWAGLRMGLRYSNVEIEAIADAIDRDASGLITVDDYLDSRRVQATDIRRQVEESVERLRFTVAGYLDKRGERWVPSTPDPYEVGQTCDVLRAEPFLAELDRIFGKDR